jgi:hypothetical protein
MWVAELQSLTARNAAEEIYPIFLCLRREDDISIFETLVVRRQKNFVRDLSSRISWITIHLFLSTESGK